MVLYGIVPYPLYLFVRKKLQIILAKPIDIIPSLEYNIYRTFLTRYNRMKYISAKEAAEKWGLSPRRVGVLCNEGRIEGAYKAGASWIIPDDAEKPNDARIKSGKYIKKDGKD
jgi:hypothetical protein